MTLRFVVDASVAVQWIVPEPTSSLAERLLSHSLIAPDLLFSECANALWKVVTRGTLSVEEAIEGSAMLQRATLETLSCRALTGRAIDLAVRFRHPACDCFYLALAEAERIPLVTADRRLVTIVERGGSSLKEVAVIPLADIERHLA